MALAFIPRVSSFLLLSALISVSPTSSFYVLEISTDGPVTSGAQACVNSTLFISNGSTTVATDPKRYHFRWMYSPLLLSHQSENESSSCITVLGNAPGNYSISVWVTERHCQSCEPVARSSTYLQITSSIVGNLSASQTEGTNSSIRDGFVEATDSDVYLSFKIHDPSDFFKSAQFRYTWTLGDGTELVTTDPSTHHYYSKPGKYKVSLYITAQVPRLGRQAEWKTGSFAVELTLLDALRSITVVGSTDATVRLKYNASLHFFGSPPLMFCWLMKSDCVSLGGHECHLVEINETIYSIGHVFNSAGRYCLSIRAENQVSTLQNYHSITVYSTDIYPLWFVLPCCALIATALGFIFFILLRPGSNSSLPKMPEVAHFNLSPSDDKHRLLSTSKGPTPGFCAYCSGDFSRDEEEAEPLLDGCAPPARHYMQ